MFKYNITYKTPLSNSYDTENISKALETMKQAFDEMELKIEELKKLKYIIGTCTVYSIIK